MHSAIKMTRLYRNAKQSPLQLTVEGFDNCHMRCTKTCHVIKFFAAT